MAKYKTVRRLTGYGCDGAAIISREIQLDPPECHTEPSTEAVIAWVEAHVGVESVIETHRTIYPEGSTIFS